MQDAAELLNQMKVEDHFMDIVDGKPASLSMVLGGDELFDEDEEFVFANEGKPPPFSD